MLRQMHRVGLLVVAALQGSVSKVRTQRAGMLQKSLSCGFQYGFEFDENQAEDDMAVATDGVTLLVDPLSLQYLVGAEVDYSEGLGGAQFVIRNPNAKTTCGCGSSFTV